MTTSLFFLRPYWLALLALLPVLGWWLARHRGNGGGWRRYLEPHLLPWLLAGGQESARRHGFVLVLPLLVATLAIVALAGPTWRQLPQPLYRAGQPVVIALDLSQSMAATDVLPSRLARARQEMSDLLDARTDGETGLIVYGADAFVASPLTDDAATIKALLPALATDLLPRQGSNATAALVRAQRLFEQAGLSAGHVLLVTDDIDDAGLNSAIALRRAGISVSVLALGTPAGAPVTLADGSLLKDRQGNIVIPTMDAGKMLAVATAGGGVYTEVAVDNRDTQALLAQFEADAGANASRTPLNTDLWREEGPWLLLAALPFAALAFRRGLLACLLIALMPMPGRVEAAGWSDLWLRHDQQGSRALQHGDPAVAATLFDNIEWRAAAHYRAGEFDKSASLLDGVGTPRAHYNRGNALARAGDIAGAIGAYESVLELDPQHADARYNLDKLREAMPPPEESGQNGGQPQDGDPDSDSDSSSEGSGEQQQQAGEPSADDNAGESGSDEKQQAGEGDATQGNAADNSRQEQSAGDGSNDETGQAADARSGESESAADDAAAREHFSEDPTTAQTSPADRDGDDGDDSGEAVAALTDGPPESEQEREARQATEQWLRRIPEDPGGLLRRKFYYQYQRQDDKRADPEKPW